MDRSLDPQTIAAMRALCEKISVSRQLDEAIQKELYAHMEDKLLGYLSGEEKVSEADALLLVEKHFGEPGKVTELLHDVYPVQTGLSFLQRLLWAFIFLSALGLAYSLAAHPVWWLFRQALNAGLSLPACYWGQEAAHTTIHLLSLGVLWWTVALGQRHFMRGRVRRLRWRTAGLAGLVAIFFVLTTFGGFYAFSYSVGAPESQSVVTQYSSFVRQQYGQWSVLRVLFAVLHGVPRAMFLWWWFTRPGWSWRWMPLWVGGLAAWMVLSPNAFAVFHIGRMRPDVLDIYFALLQGAFVQVGYFLAGLMVGGGVYFLLLRLRGASRVRPGVS